MFDALKERARALRWAGCGWDGSFHYAFGGNMATLRKYEYNAKTGGEDAGEEVNRRTQEYMSKNPGTHYGAAMRLVLDDNPDLKKRYAEVRRG